VAFIAAAAYLFVQPTSFNKAIAASSEGNEEALKHKALDQLMLADPNNGYLPGNIRAEELAYYHSVFGNAPHLRNGNWQSVGPANVGGRTRAAVIDATNENIIIAAGVSGGIWRTTNAGNTWQRVSDPTQYMGAVSLAQDTRPGKQNVWYSVTGELSGNSASGGGAYYLGDGAFKSIDSGKSWQPLKSTSGGTPNAFSQNWQAAWRIATHPSMDSDYVFVACYGMIYRTSNGDSSWRASLGNTANNSYYSDIAIAKNGDIYATLSSDGVTKGFYRSTDIGLTWTNITPTQFISNYERTVMDINPNNENEVYFFTYLADSTNPGGTKTSNYSGTAEYMSLLKYTYLSGNGSGAGGQWVDLSNNLPNNANSVTGPFDKLNLQGGYDMLVRVQPQTNNLFIAGTNLFISTDGFTTKNNFKQIGGYKIGTGLPRFEVFPDNHPDHHDVIFYPNKPNKILNANDGGLYVSENVTAANIIWKPINNGYTTTQPYAVTLSSSAYNRYIHAGFQDNGNYILNDYTQNTKPWVMPFNGDGAYAYVSKNNSFFVMTIQEGRMGKFRLDAEGNRLEAGRIDPAGATRDDYLFINPFAVDPNDENIMYVPAGKKIFRQNQLLSLSTNTTWDSITTGYTQLSDTVKSTNTSGGFPAQISCIAVSKQPANVVYVGTTTRDIYRIDSANTGNPKLKLINKAPMTAGYVSSIAIDPDDANKVLVCFSNYSVLRSIYYSKDGGNTWKFCGGNLDKTTNFSGAAPSIRAVGILKTPDGKRKYFVGTSIGLYSVDSLIESTTSVGDSTKWVQESPQGIGTSVVNHLYIRQSDYMVAVSTHGNGVYTSQYFPAPPPPTPVDFEISIYPNPLRNDTKIQLALPEDVVANIALYTTNGQIVRNWKNQTYKQGTEIINFDANNLVTGVYYFVYTDDKKRIIKRKLLVAH
jgi:photosystem II stability/assembly factor-like uncharacterized protein